MKITYNNGVISVYLNNVFHGWQQVVYLFSDVHFDSVYSRREKYLEHLEVAKKENAIVIDGGDLFDAMQGRFDPRRSMDELRPEYRREDYYDFVVQDVAKHLAPFSGNLLALGSGNHELAVRKNANTDLTERLVAELRRNGAPTVRIGFKGWIRFMFMRPGKKNGEIPGGSIVVRYSHSGGSANAPVSRGVMDSNRQAVYLPDADIVWNGHNHQGWLVPIARERLSNKGVVYQDIAWFVRTPGYKAEYIADDFGYAAQKVTGPAPIGCVRLVLSYDGAPSVKANLVLE